MNEMNVENCIIDCCPRERHICNCGTKLCQKHHDKMWTLRTPCQ